MFRGRSGLPPSPCCKPNLQEHDQLTDDQESGQKLRGRDESWNSPTGTVDRGLTKPVIQGRPLPSFVLPLRSHKKEEERS